MPNRIEKYEVVIGLEVHAQLLTASKLFCGDNASFGGMPNTHLSPITLAHPGTLPVMNKKAVTDAVAMGLACGCEIEQNNYFARKHYFYPDSPKGYQISQHTTPICTGGYIQIKTDSGEKKIRLHRIHLEEDAGKSLHDIEPGFSSIDFNRAGVPLIEIVTEPDIRSAEEAQSCVSEIRKLLRYLKICDGNMEEGSLRCDANVSIRLPGEKKLGTKVEVKNLNSIRHLKQALAFEVNRMIQLTESGMPIVQQTRSFDAATGTTFSLRTKEEANDYRYFTDPDLPPFRVTETFIAEIRRSLPALPEELTEKYTKKLLLSDYDARLIADDKETADYFEKLIRETTNYKSAANWLLGPIKSWLNEHHLVIADFSIPPVALAKLIRLVDEGHIHFSMAVSHIFPVFVQQPKRDPAEIAIALNLQQNSNGHEINLWIDQALASMPDKVAAYKKGRKGLIGVFIGEVKKISAGRADPILTNQLLLEKLSH